MRVICSRFIGNPDLVARICQGAPFHALEKTTMYGSGPEGYSDDPSLTAAAA